ncbi:MAG: hypothetical protein U0359_31960 [Byssovorax sp.]
MSTTSRKPARIHAGVRLDAEVVAKARALIPELSTTWRKATLTDVLRHLVLLGLDRVEERKKSVSD